MSEAVEAIKARRAFGTLAEDPAFREALARAYQKTPLQQAYSDRWGYLKPWRMLDETERAEMRRVADSLLEAISSEYGE